MHMHLGSCVTSGQPRIVAERSWVGGEVRGSVRAMSLYDELGGEAAVDAAVDVFYRKVLADERIAGFFVGVDMDQQKRKQRAFLTVALGGPNKYTGRGMRMAHARAVSQGLSDVHFDAVVGHLAATLRELGVPDEKVAEAGAIVETTRDQVLGRSGAA